MFRVVVARVGEKVAAEVCRCVKVGDEGNGSQCHLVFLIRRSFDRCLVVATRVTQFDLVGALSRRIHIVGRQEIWDSSCFWCFLRRRGQLLTRSAVSEMMTFWHYMGSKGLEYLAYCVIRRVLLCVCCVREFVLRSAFALGMVVFLTFVGVS